MSIVKKQDFTGVHSVAQNKYTDMGAYIEKYEKHYLLRLLGADLYNAFIADLSGDPGVPVSARFLDIFNPFCYDDGSCVRQSEGIKKMLIQFIYFHYVRDTEFQHTTQGVIRSNTEASTPLAYTGYDLIECYNSGVENYHQIQCFIDDNFSTYPEENMQFLGFISSIVR